jgi:hypothetical protein
MVIFIVTVEQLILPLNPVVYYGLRGIRVGFAHTRSRTVSTATVFSILDNLFRQRLPLVGV